MNKIIVLLLFMLPLFFEVNAQNRMESEQTEIIQFSVLTSTVSKKIEDIQLLQSKTIDEKISVGTHPLNHEGIIQFDVTDAEENILYSVKQDNPCFINYEYANEKGELGHYKNLEPQATLLVKIPVLKNASSIKVYQIDTDGKQILISSFTFQNNSWK